MQGILQKLLLVLVVLGAINIVLLLIIKSKSKKSKENQNVKNKNQIDEKSSIKVLNYERKLSHASGQSTRFFLIC